MPAHNFLIKLLLCFLSLLVVSCNNTEDPVGTPVVPVKPLTPRDSASWDGAQREYNAYGMRKIFAKGYSFVLGAREDQLATVKRNEYGTPGKIGSARCSLTYNYFMDTVELNGYWYNALTSLDNLPWHPETENLNAPISVNVGTALYLCNRRSQYYGLDTVYVYDSLSKTDSKFSYEIDLHNVRMNLNAKGFRLPFSSEWIYAYRGGYQTTYFWATDLFDRSVALEYGWIGYAYNDQTAAPSALLKPNPYGLYDLLGNQEELVHYVFDASVEDSTVVNPVILPSVEPKMLTAMGGDFTGRHGYTPFGAWEGERQAWGGIRMILQDEISDQWSVY